MKNNIVSIRLWNKEVGKIYWDSRLRKAVFEYDKAFIAQGIDIAPLTSSIFGEAGKRPITGNKEKPYNGLPPFIADSLPDKWGNMVFDCWAKEQNLPKQDISVVDKLSFIGNRAMGALEFRPAVNLKKLQDNLQLSSLYDLAQRIFEEREQVQILPDESLTLQSLYSVGTSAGGQHPKAIIAIDNNTHTIRSGQVDWGGDYKYYILKFAESSSFPHALVEMAYYRMAVDCGITMMPSRLIAVDHQLHFLTERFDRKNGKKVHIQTLSAMDEEATSYEQLFAVARKLKISQLEQDELFLRAVFNLLSGNVDDHKKNFSFLLEQGHSDWHITPAYDMTFTATLDGFNTDNNHSLSFQSKVRDFTTNDMIDFAINNNIKQAIRKIEKIESVLSLCWQYLTEEGVSRFWADKIEKHISTLLPGKYKSQMTHFLPTMVDEYIDANGHLITNLTIDETYQHNFHLYATIDGIRKKHIFANNSDSARIIAEAGGIHLSQDVLKDLSRTYLLKNDE